VGRALTPRTIPSSAIEGNRGVTLARMPVARQPPQGVSASAPLQASTGGSSGSFLVKADDGEQYWCKSVNNLQSPKVPVNEQIVGRLGMLIGACVCAPQLVYIPAALVGWEFRPGHFLEEGWAHGCLAVRSCVEIHVLDHRLQDDNRKRHAGIYAIYDWLGGSDPQWLIETTDDNRCYSHDHGHYLWGPDWGTASLAEHRDQPCEYGTPKVGLDGAEVERLADALDNLNEKEIGDTLGSLPIAWPVTDDELDAVMNLAVHRRSAAAARLRAVD
jgi:hypothetical protein